MNPLKRKPNDNLCGRLLALLFFATVGAAQGQGNATYQEQMKREYENFRQNANSSYNSFRDKANADYAKFIRKSWEDFHTMPAIPVPQSPDPVSPVKKEEDKKPENNPLPQGNVVPLPEQPKQPEPVEPIPATPMPENKPVLNFIFYGIPCKVYWDSCLSYKINSIDKNNLADLWTRLSSKAYNGFLSDCIGLRSKLSLCDWAYINLLQTLGSQIFGNPKSNEAVFLQIFVLSQTGYKVRLAEAGENQLLLLINSDYDIYESNYLEIENARFYIVDKDVKDAQIHVLNAKLPNEQSFSMRIESEQLFNKTESYQKLFKSEKYPVETIKTGVNKDLIDFYNSYPHCDWKVYAGTPLSSTVKNNLYPALFNVIKGKSKTEAADMLLNFVQTAFQYQTDGEQFGYERPFFPDELFYYPYCDCEDRAILFSTIIRDLLNLNVVLLHYPNHLATAVHFDETVSGDYVTVNNRKYLVCDPTYIGASIGEAMPDFSNTQVEIIQLKH